MRIGLVAGEASGDTLGAGLILEILKTHPRARFEGVAGPQMSAAGCEVWEDAEALAVMGLVEPLKEIPRLVRLRRNLAARWIESPPDVFIGIDAPDFNIGLEKRLRANGIKTMHYVSPSVWAWRQGRVRKIAKAVDKVLCLLPFEKDFYDKHGVPAEFIGHPLADNIPENLDRHEERLRHGINKSIVIAVMPGSRVGEVTRLGSVFVATARQLAERYTDIAFIAPMATQKVRRIFEAQLVDQGVEELFTVIDGEAQSAIAASDVVLLASGTAALEAALLRRPIVAAYRLAPLTFFVGHTCKMVKLKYVTLPNLLTQVPHVPEFLQKAATAENLGGAVADLLEDSGRRELIEEAFAQLRDDLRRGADARAAAAVLAIATESR
jgi:lipid-A-disaccharide synthase